MDEEPKSKPINWSSIIGGLVFLLAIAGGPILRMVRNLASGSFSWQWLPILVGGVVGVIVLVSVVRAFNQSRAQRDVRLPTSPLPQSQKLPVPPFAQNYTPPPQPRFDRVDSPEIQPPRFDPIFNPKLLAIGIGGVLLIGIGALIMISVAP